MRLEQILKRYDGTPFGVTPAGPVTIVARITTATVRGWSERMKSTTKVAKSESLRPIELIVEVTPAKGIRLVASPQLSLSAPPAPGLKRLGDLQETSFAKQNDEKNSAVRIGTRRFVSRLEQIGTLKPGDVIVPVHFKMTTRDSNDVQRSVEGKIDVVVPISRVKKVASADSTTTGVALIGGMYDGGD